MTLFRFRLNALPIRVCLLPCFLQRYIRGYIAGHKKGFKFGVSIKVLCLNVMTLFHLPKLFSPNALIYVF